MSLPMIQLARLIHIVLGAFWLGSQLFLMIFLLPTLRALGPGSGPVMNQIAGVRKLPLYMMFVPILTLLSGLALMWNDSAGSPGWMRSGPGRAFSTGAAFAIVAMIVGMAVNSPAGRKLAALAAASRSGPPSPEQQAEMGRLQHRLNRATQVSAVLVLIATGFMAIARYM